MTGAVPLAVLILGRDIALSISAFYFRYASLPPPVCRTFPIPYLLPTNARQLVRRKPSPATGISPSRPPLSTPPPSRNTIPSCSSCSSELRLSRRWFRGTSRRLLRLCSAFPSSLPHAENELIERVAWRRWIVAGTTVWSGLSYVGAGSSAAVKYIK